MKIKEQLQYLNEILAHFSDAAGIDISDETTRRAVIYIHNDANGYYDEFGIPDNFDEIEKAAAVLMSKYGKSDVGKKALIHLGQALLFSEGSIFLNLTPKSIDYSYDRSRAICDYSFVTGVACTHLSNMASTKGHTDLTSYFSAITPHEVAKKAVRAKLANDPKQEEKKTIRAHWVQWKAYPARYESKAEFARYMLKVCKHLKSQKKIEDWCREWEKEETMDGGNGTVLAQ